MQPLSNDYPSSGLSPDTTQRHNEPNGQPNSRTPLPVEEDIMQLARLGEIGAIQKLFDKGKFDARYKDDQGITPLHWAAQKNHYALCHFLIQAGADVNAKGGDLEATPAAWAARNCNYYVVNLLLDNGADPLRSDNQGFNLLHSATMDGNVFQILLILHYDVPVDTADEKGHTSLMWAAYKGFAPCVEVLLQWGASVDARDEQGFTPLHWALVRGSQPCIQKLIEYGADKYATTVDGKTPATVAREMNSMHQWHRALADSGYTTTGSPRAFPFSWITNDRSMFLSRFYYFWPFLILFTGFYIITGMPIYAGAPISVIAVFGLQTLGQQLLQWGPPNMKHLHHTSYMSGVFGASLFWVGVTWFLRILPQTMRINPIINLLFALFLTSTLYFYLLTMFEDPGYCPKSTSRSEQKDTVQELIKLEFFDEPHFCINCMIRKPLRSKHCRRCGRCVAKEDHHCPWVNNCVANNNHRHFFLYIFSLEVGIGLFIPLAYSYITSLPATNRTECYILSPSLCDSYNKDPFSIAVAIWATLQLSWLTMLIVVQLIQVARAQTTYENMKGHTQLSGASGIVTSAFVAGTTSLEGAELTDRGRGPDATAPGHKHKHAKREGCFEQWKKLLGVDTFVATAMHGSKAGGVAARNKPNPFTRGVVTNCRDFFCEPAPLFGKKWNGTALLGGQDVDYTRMWEPPPRTTVRGALRRGDGNMSYEAVSTDDNV